MPFPWKKAKITRISRLVSDLRQSPKRGRSLVVQTGFPTSLVDLFVKNRDRLRKSPKRRSSPQSQTAPTNPPSSPPQSFPAPHCNAKLQHGTDSCGLIELEDDCVEKIQIAESKFDCVGVGKGCESSEMETRREILTGKSERSRSARINRNFIKKFVPKKLRHGKKQGKSNNKNQWGVDIHKMDEIEEEKPEELADDDDNGEDESQREEESCKEIEELLWVESEMGIVKDKVENVRKGKSGYLILFVIVLAGLVGGRGVALLLTLVWCLILRYIGRC